MKKLFLSLLGFLVAISTWAGDYAKYYDGLPTQVKAVEAVKIPANEVKLTEVGGVGDGVTLCTDALKPPDGAPSRSGRC